MMCTVYMLFLCITAVESLRIRGLQNSSARACESIKGLFSNLARGQDFDQICPIYNPGGTILTKNVILLTPMV